MMEKLKNIFKNKEKRVQNLVAFLIILVITLLIINKILNEDKPNNNIQNSAHVELAEESSIQTSNNLENKLENILSKINGVGKVSVLITYSEGSSLIPIYNINSSLSTTEEKDTSGGTRTIETETNEKNVVTDASSNIVTEKVLMPVIEGAVITAQGASNSEIKSNIISAVEAVTGISAHKIQVFEMGD